MDPVRAAARDLLRTHGPMSLPDLAARLTQDGHELAEDLAALDDHFFPLQAPEWSPTELADGRLADPEHLLDGLVLTTRLSAGHVADGQPTFSPDLDPLLEFLVSGGLPLAGGGMLQVDLVDDEWQLSGTTGWMPGQAGQLLVARVADGRLHFDAIGPDGVAEDSDLLAQLADVHDHMREHLAGVELPDLVLELRARHPLALSAPHRPLGELLEDAGLDRYGDWVVFPDELDEDGRPFDLFGAGDADPGTSLEALSRHLVDDHGMTEDQADEFVLLRVLTTGVRLSPPDDLDDRERQAIELSRLLAGDDPDDPALDDDPIDFVEGLPRLEQLFADDEVAQAVPGDLLARDIVAAGPFAVLARRVARGSRDRYAKSNAWWLYAQALEFLDADGLDTERALRQALEASADHVGAAADLAWHLDDRGKAGAALGMLVEHGLGDTEWAEQLRAWARPGPAAAGRNDPCPCGSGRKHKVCCARTNGWPLLDRIDWVLAKLAQFGGRLTNSDLVDAIAARAGLATGGQQLPDDMAVTSLCLFDGGLVLDFCDQRGPLVPADELELLREWAEVYASAYEIVEVDPGAGMVLLDLTTGERHEVVEHSASQQLQPREVLLTWLVPYPDGTTRIALGGVHVPVQNRAALLALLDRDPSAEELAGWYASLHAPPRMHNTDGDPLTICRTLVQVPDAEEARAALAAVGDEAGELIGRPGARLEAEADSFHLVAQTDTGPTLIGAVRLDGVQLELETNSIARMEALQALVLGRVPGAEVFEDTRTPMEDLIGDDEGLGDDEDDDLAGGAADLDPFGALDDLDPEERAEMVEALDAWMAEAEERWCDQQVPALGGITPRQAAEDPTRRPDLQALLDEFPAVEATPGQPRGMDPDRLRALLGL